MKALRLTMVGVYPPPYGGVSIHVQRLLAGCLENNIQAAVFDLSLRSKKSANVLNFFWNWPRLFFGHYDIIHVHTVNRSWQVPWLFGILARLKRAGFVVTYHSLRYRPEDFSRLGRRMTKVVLKSASCCVTINAVIRERLVALGAPPGKVSVVSPYLPPLVKQEEITAVPPSVWTFIAAHRPVISANAFAIIRDKGVDLYGIDMCVELCAALKKLYPAVGLVFFLPDIRDYEYFHELKRRIAEKGIGDNFLFQTRPCQLYPVIMKSDIFVRPTVVDSYGVSVAEAIHFKVPAVASDVCLRPEGAVLFKRRDEADFIRCVKAVWENHPDFKAKLETAGPVSALGDILAIYRALSPPR